MLLEIMKYIRNFFNAENEEGTFTIVDGKVSLPFISRYVLIEGSKFNDGIHECPINALTDEEFTGCITAVNPPDDFLKLVAEIEEYTKKFTVTPFLSESFGGYSYQRGTNGKGAPLSWEDVFRDRLKVWCKA